MSLSCLTKKEFILTWKIENSLFTVDACLESPTFLARNLLNTKWSLKLVVKIVNGVHQLFCVLKRDYEDEGPTDMGIHFKIHLGRKYYPCDCIFSRGTSESVILFPIMGFLKKDGQKRLCTIQCILWMWDDKPQHSTVRCIAQTRILIRNFTKTKQFSWITTKLTEDAVFNLKCNSTDESVFTLALKLNILVGNKVTIKIKNATTRNVFLSGRISVQNDKGDFLYSAHDHFIFGNGGNVWEFPFEFSMEMSKRILGSEWKRRNLLLLFEFFIPEGIESSNICVYEYSNKIVKGPLKVYVHRHFKSKTAESQTADLNYPSKFVCTNDSAVQTVNADYSRILDELPLKIGKPLKADIRQYFKIPIPVPSFPTSFRHINPDMMQYCLDVFKYNFFFHHNRRFFFILSVTVLCLALAFGYYFSINNSSEVQTQPLVFNSNIYVKSDTFNATFQINITETEYDTRNIIADLNEVTLNDFLVSVFSEEMESLQWTKVINLLHVAYEHHIGFLETKCTSFLVSRMSVSNVCEILLIADEYEDIDLKRSAKDFVRLHASEIFASNQWKDFMLYNPKLAAETVNYYSKFDREN